MKLFELGGKMVVATALAFVVVPVSAQILVGQAAGFSGPVAAGVKETTEGAQLYIDKINSEGGINGQKIELVSMDDKFNPKLSAETARTLVEDKRVIALFLSRGTPNTEAMIPVLDKEAIPLIAPSTGAMSLHEPLQRHVFNVRSTYQKEAERAVIHLTTVGLQRIAVVHADDSFGRDALAGAMKGFDIAKLKPVDVIKADRSKPDFGPIVKRILDANSQTVLWFGSGNAVADGIKLLRSKGSAARIVTLSNNASAGFVKSLGKDARGVIVSQVFPSERSVANPFVGEADKLAKEKGRVLSPAMLEGFAAAKVLVEGLRRAGPKPTREKLQAALEHMKDFNLGGGLKLSYSAENHTGLDFVDLSIITDDGHFLR
jgi:branched-chain amino acid transport system substrate-binding protein